MRIGDRFWSKVHRKGADDCWPWMRYQDRKGYGHITVNGQNWAAHRLAWKLTFGHIPMDQHVLHRCDNPTCCNPAHLFLGTNADNMKDRRAKNGYESQARGEEQGSAKLNRAQVLAIRSEYNAGESSMPELARHYPIGISQIHRIIHHESWAWLPEEEANCVPN